MSQMWQRRHAVQIVAQLPEDVADALAVLEEAKKLVEGFLAEPGQAPLRPEGRDVVMLFPTSSNSH